MRTRSQKPKSKSKGKARPARGVTKPRRGAQKKAPRKLRQLKPQAPRRVVENPKAKALAQRISRLISDKKGLDVVILDVRGMTSYADYFVIGSGESDRQVAAMADHVLTELKQEGERAVGSEGTETANWVLLDYGEVVAHLFFTESRSFYDLEGLSADAPRERVA